MKTRDPETISFIWQLAHLKHYFGYDRAMSSMRHHNPELIVNNGDDNQNDRSESKCASSSELGPDGSVCPKVLDTDFRDKIMTVDAQQMPKELTILTSLSNPGQRP